MSSGERSFRLRGCRATIAAVGALLLRATVAVPAADADPAAPVRAGAATAPAPCAPAGARAAAVPRAVTLPFSIDHNRMIVDAEFVRPDGSIRVARAWIDTGNQFLILGETLARDLGIDVSGLEGAASPAPVESASPPPPVRLGGLTLDMAGIAVRVRPGTRVWPGVPAELNLPASALRHNQVVFDYPGSRLTVAQAGLLKPRGVAVPCQVNPETGLFMVAAVLDGDTVRLGVDNGSAGTWVSDSLTTRWAARHPDWPRATGAVGSANFFGFQFEPGGALMRLPELRVGEAIARDVAVLGLDRRLFDWYSTKSAGKVAGFIGGNVLLYFRLEVDYPNRMTYWEANPWVDWCDTDIVGLTLQPQDDSTTVVAGIVMKDGSPTVPDVQVGDRLIRAGTLDCTKATMGEIVGALRGLPGRSRTLVLDRDGRRITVEAPIRRLP